jgi:hypothetical protein
MSSRHNRSATSARGERNAPRKRRPPWGGLLGGKPIKRQVWNFDERIDLGEEHVRRMQFFRMRLLKEHYNIIGGDEYPIKGVVAAGWLPWYQLALAIASEARCRWESRLALRGIPRRSSFHCTKPKDKAHS